jgi:hypothetical protein
MNGSAFFKRCNPEELRLTSITDSCISMGTPVTIRVSAGIVLEGMGVEVMLLRLIVAKFSKMGE